MMNDNENLSPAYTLDHVCLAVRLITPARKMLERTLGFNPRTGIVENTRQMVNVQFLAKLGSIDIKLIAPSCPDSPLVHFLKKTGGGLHHLAFRTDSVPEGVDDLKAKGAKIVTFPEPGEAFDDNLISFAYLGMGLNVELIDTVTRRSEVAAGQHAD